MGIWRSHPETQQPNKSYRWTLAILALGLVYLFFLQSLLSDGVFFTGDSGLKALLSQDIAAGHFGFNLSFPDPPWVRALWAEGLFPFQEPFVYVLAGKYFITFPYTFSLVTAPFYILFGYRGLYVLPFLATLAVWLVFYRLCRKLDFSPAATALGVAFLIFASNLSLYSAMYWEHTLSVCLAFSGLALLFPTKGQQHLRWGAVAWAGILSALAVWFRPEQVFLVLFLDAFALWALLQPRLPLPNLGRLTHALARFAWVFPLASTLTLLLYGLTNWIIYKNFFGVHAIQVIEQHPLRERLLSALGNIRLMTIGTYSLFLYLPVALLPLAYLLFAWYRPNRARLDREWIPWYIFMPAFLLGVAILVPYGAGGKQWGPRFLLLLVPIILLLFTWQFDRFLHNPPQANPRLRPVVLALILLFSLLGILQNPVRGRDFLINNYHQIQPAVAALRAQAQPVVAVSDQYLAQAFEPALDRSEIFLLVTDEAQMGRFSAALLEQGQNDFTYLCYSFDCKLFNPGEPSRRLQYGEVSYTLQTVDQAEYGRYRILSVQLSRANE